MFSWIKDWLNQRIISRSGIKEAEWHHAFACLPLLKGLNPEEIARLRELSILFMHHKLFEGAQGLEITQHMRMLISLQACLPVLNLGLGCYKNFVTIIVYPSGFITKRLVMDENGIVDHDHAHATGEAWQRGPVILAWDDSESAGIIDGENLVIHEFAHKLDMQNGIANGFPPLHADMRIPDWVNTFTQGYEDFLHKCHGDNLHGINCYGATSPAEFFSVMSEVFFERPDIIHKYYPEIHRQLELYYRQRPITRFK